MHSRSGTTGTEDPRRAGPHLPDDGLDEAARACSIGSHEPGGTAILLVSHGSHSPVWRHALLDVQADTAEDLLRLPGVRQVRSAFMEYTEPSIASQLRALDEARVATVLIVPLLLTISDHSYDDIPVICGVRDDATIAARLAREHIETYRAQAHLVFAPLLDFSQLVERNLARRLAPLLPARDTLGASAERLGLVLVGYGSADFDREWNQFFGKIDRFAEAQLGVDGSVHAWCGHLVQYSAQPTVEAIDAMLARYDRVALVPIFVAYDPMFHETILGRALQQSSCPERVSYSCTAILPEPEVAQWVVEIAGEMLNRA
ncbi:MAG: cobalamin biosynthesis protein CbiX [Dehalococcoidia bacterium]|nr:cobalamin biosynthesis protein CbiX [Dehalococcoidia bacterium]